VDRAVLAGWEHVDHIWVVALVGFLVDRPQIYGLMGGIGLAFIFADVAERVGPARQHTFLA